MEIYDACVKESGRVNRTARMRLQRPRTYYAALYCDSLVQRGYCLHTSENATCPSPLGVLYGSRLACLARLGRLVHDVGHTCLRATLRL